MTMNNSINSPVKAVIFDMDGVIINSEPVHQQAEREFALDLGFYLDSEEHSRYVGTTSSHMWTKLKEEKQLPNSVKSLVEKSRTKYFSLLKKAGESLLIPHVRTLIKNLYDKGVELALASSAPHDQIQYVCRLFNLENYFSIYVSGDDVEKGKPEPDIFLLTAEELDIAPADCLVIEDSTNGVTAAKKAGMKVIGYFNPSSGSQSLTHAHGVITSFENFDPLTLKWETVTQD